MEQTKEQLAVKAFGVESCAESKAYDLYCIGKSGVEIAETLLDEFTDLDADQIDKAVNDACERFNEKQNQHEL